ncbi:MAG: HDOD domain-containing protein [Pseudomonadota bacterium]
MKRIIFVDDDPNILAGLEDALWDQDDRWEMSFLLSAEAALDELAKKPADILVTDVRMPGMDGIALLHRVRDAFPEIVRIVLSGQSELDLTLSELPLVHQFLGKPCEARLLKETLERASNLEKLLPDRALRQQVGKLGSLPCLRSRIQELRDVLQKQQVTLQEIAKVAEQEPVVLARVLQLANSALFGPQLSVSSAVRSVSRLGLDVLRSLLRSDAFFSAEPGSEGTLVLLHRHALLTARIAACLCGENLRGQSAAPGPGPGGAEDPGPSSSTDCGRQSRTSDPRAMRCSAQTSAAATGSGSGSGSGGNGNGGSTGGGWTRSALPPDSHPSSQSLGQSLGQSLDDDAAESKAEAALCGMLHGFGRLALTFGLPDYESHILVPARQSGRQVLDVEKEVLGATHADVGAYLLGLWGIPKNVIDVIKQHHDPRQAVAMPIAPADAVYLAEVLAIEAEESVAAAQCEKTTRTEGNEGGRRIDVDAIFASLGLGGVLSAWRTIASENARQVEAEFAARVP